MFLAVVSAVALTITFSGTMVEASAATAAAPDVPLLGALGPTSNDATLSASRFREVVIGANWATIEPAEGSYSPSAISALQSQITAAKAAGLQPSLDLGVQYSPNWLFGVGGGTRFVDQYGDVFTGPVTSGNDVANAVTDPAVRTQLADYVSYLGSHLSGVSAVRVGGGALNELRYPSGSSGTAGNAYWFYDASSQAALPTAIRGWKPGTGTVADAEDFLNAYNSAMVNYGVWLAYRVGESFSPSPELEVLMPGWGQRPGEAVAAEDNLLKATPDEINQGLDWVDLLKGLPDTSKIVAYSTYADATNGTASNPDPAAFIHAILPTGMAAGGESTGNGHTTSAGLYVMFCDAHSYHWYVANWFFHDQPQTLASLGDLWG